MRRLGVPGGLLCGALVLVVGCASVRGPGTFGLSRARVVPYDDALEAATVRGILYSGFDRVFSASVTLLTPAMRSALDDELARLHRDELAVTLGLGPTEGEGIDLFLFLDARDPGWEDLDRRASTFRVELLRGGESLPARLVRRLDEDDPTLRHLFPWTHDFGRLYRFHVPGAVAGTEGVRVRIGGAPGSLEMGF